ncbi:MAG: phosphate acyltransferase, partial [Myxococcota bacterium]
SFGPDYIIPKPFDPRVLLYVAPAVAEAAAASGVAREPIADLEAYREQLHALVERARGLITPLIRRARSHDPQRIAFPMGSDPTVLRAAQILVDEQICHPVLVGDGARIQAVARDVNVDLSRIEIVEPGNSTHLDDLARALWEARQRKGVSRSGARESLLNPIVFASMMLKAGLADGMVGGPGRPYSATLRPALQVLGVAPGCQVASGVYAVLFRSNRVFLGDCTVNVNPDAETLAEIALNTARVAETFGVRPRVAMLSYSNFGEHREDAEVRKVIEATALVRQRRPDLEVDGEMQADTAVDFETLTSNFDFSRLTGPANVLVFPSLTSGNIAYKLIEHLSTAEVLGPMLAGVGGPVNVVPINGDVNAVVNTATYTANQALDTKS